MANDDSLPEADFYERRQGGDYVQVSLEDEYEMCVRTNYEWDDEHDYPGCKIARISLNVWEMADFIRALVARYNSQVDEINKKTADIRLKKLKPVETE